MGEQRLLESVELVDCLGPLRLPLFPVPAAFALESFKLQLPAGGTHLRQLGDGFTDLLNLLMVAVLTELAMFRFK
jgi:hypothetical protein